MSSQRIHGSGDEPLRKISKTGKYTYYVTIPKADLKALGWRERHRVRVTRQGDKLVIEKP